MMGSLRYLLREHASAENPKVHDITAGDGEVPVLYSIGNSDSGMLRLCTPETDRTEAAALLRTPNGSLE